MKYILNDWELGQPLITSSKEEAIKKAKELANDGFDPFIMIDATETGNFYLNPDGTVSEKPDGAWVDDFKMAQRLLKRVYQWDSKLPLPFEIRHEIEICLERIARKAEES